MKRIIKLPVIVLGLLLLLTGTTQKTMAQDDDISLQSFYDELSPYGAWIQDPQYGYVWRPEVDQDDFRPYYTNGRWAMTEYGNTWVSDYDWGWAPFHYGRWVLNRYQQWVWLPDTVWGPAWVSWRSGGGYYGWAPLGPGININVNIGSYNIPNNWWVFIPQRNIYDNRYPRYSGRNVTIINQTTIINNTYRRNRNTYYVGPRADEIRRVTNRDVKVYNVSRASKPGRTSISNNNINIYNPRFGRSGDAAGTAARPGQPDRNNPGRGNSQGQRRDMDGRNGQSGQERIGQVQRSGERNNPLTQQQLQQRQQARQQRENQRQQQTQQTPQQVQQRQQQTQQAQQQLRQQQQAQQAQQRQQAQQQRESQRQQQAQQRQQQTQQAQQQLRQQQQAQQAQQRQQQAQQRQQQTQQRQQQMQQQRQQQMQQRQQQQQQQQSTPPVRSRSGGAETRGGRNN